MLKYNTVFIRSANAKVLNLSMLMLTFYCNNIYWVKFVTASDVHS